MGGKRRHLKYSDAGNIILDQMIGAGIPAATYLDGLLREADSAWRGSVARLRAEGWTLVLYEMAMTALGPVDGTETASVVVSRLQHCTIPTEGAQADAWRRLVEKATADTAMLRALLLLSRANGRGLGPLIREAMTA